MFHIISEFVLQRDLREKMFAIIPFLGLMLLWYPGLRDKFSEQIANWKFFQFLSILKFVNNNNNNWIH